MSALATLRRVLVVDDDADARAVHAECLEDAGFEVLQASDGAAAVQAATQSVPLVIIMDLEMPVMGGLEAILRLKVDARTRAIPVIVLSGNGLADQATAERAGCHAYLTKPCAVTALVDAVRRLVFGWEVSDTNKPEQRDPT